MGEHKELSGKGVLIGMPNRDDFKGETVGTVARLVWDACGSGNHPGFVSINSCFIDAGRNQMVEVAKQSNSDYLLFLDSDIAVLNPADQNVIKRWVDLDKDVVVGLYVDRRPPHRVHIYDWQLDGKMINMPEWPSEPFKVGGGPTGYMMISKRVLDAFTPEAMERLGKPFDFYKYGTIHQLGEDLSFCRRVRDLGFEVWADPAIMLKHFGKDGYTVEDYKISKDAAAARFENGIQGWMTPVELEFLAMLANRYGTVVEIGSWKGRSTKALLDAGRKIYAVDTWEGSQDVKDLTYEMAKKEDIFAEFKKNVGHYHHLKIMKMESAKAADKFADESVDMVFIDSEHTYEAVRDEIKRWRPKVKKMICGHDYAECWPGVRKAVDEAFGEKAKKCASIWYVEVGV